MVVVLSTWYWGHLAGAVTLLASAASINCALLKPRWLWLAIPEAMTPTAIYFDNKIGIFARAETLRRCLHKMEGYLAGVTLSSETEVRMRRIVEQERHRRIAEM
jgi:hypothetical protein